MEAKATARFIRMSPRKIRLLADLVRGKSVTQALLQLQVATKAAKGPLRKILESARANAEVKKMNQDQLYVQKIMVDSGPTLKRFRARAMGRAAPIRKRTSHITIILGEK